MRWTTGVGIVVGGTVGATAAFLGTPRRAPVVAEPRAATAFTPVSELPATVASGPVVTSGSARSEDTPLDALPKPDPSAAASADAVLASAAPSQRVDAAPAVSEAPFTAPAPLALPTTREALMKAALYCDQRRDADECTRAALAHDSGSAGPKDPVQATRFRRIAMTLLVQQCEQGSPHACFGLVHKYRSGEATPKNAQTVEALQKRALELCRLRDAPECPPR